MRVKVPFRISTGDLFLTLLEWSRIDNPVGYLPSDSFKALLADGTWGERFWVWTKIPVHGDIEASKHHV